MSDSNFLFLNAHEAMLRAGIDVDEVYRRIGIDPSLLLQPGTRIPHEGQAGFWAAAEAVSGDAEIGLHICPFISPFAGEIVNTLLIHSTDLREGLDRSLRYMRLVSDHIVLRLEAVPDSELVQLVGRLGAEGMPRHTEIVLCFTILQMTRLACSGKFKPLQLNLQCAPGKHPEEFEKIFGCPVAFNAVESSCIYDRSMLSLPLLHADPDMVKVQEGVAQRRMRQVQRQEIVDGVRRAVAAQLNDKACTLNSIAAQLRRSPRSLRTELLDAGTSFNQIVTEEQQSLAKRLLANTSMSAEQIGHRAGFSERSAFFRAFKRWTGLTPQQYRHSRQGEAK